LQEFAGDTFAVRRTDRHIADLSYIALAARRSYGSGMLRILILTTMLLSGCLVHERTKTSSRTVVKQRDCPPAHHWDGGACVHNGKAKGHNK
jgi:hypothetical protein